MKRFILLVIAMMFIAGCGMIKGEVYVSGSEAAMKSVTHEEAVRQYHESVKKNVHSHHYYNGLGDIHAYYGYFGEAVNAYTRAIRNSDKPVYHLKRGRAYMRLHIYRDAIIDFSYVVQVKGNSLPVAYVYRAKAHVESGDFKSAVSDLNKAKRRGGGRHRLSSGMGGAVFQNGEVFRSEKIYPESDTRRYKQSRAVLPPCKSFFIKRRMHIRRYLICRRQSLSTGDILTLRGCWHGYTPQIPSQHTETGKKR